MATEKILNTRIQLKYDTLANWNGSTFIPKKGEMCIATVTTATKDSKGNIIHVPTVLVKVGDNENVFSALPFVSAPAADVYDWAKKDEATFVANFLNMKNGDQTMQSLLDGVFATDEELSTAIAGVQGQINAINTKLGDLSKLNTTYKTDLVGAINEALQAVEVGGTGSVVSVIVSDVEGGKSYQVTQGGKNVGSAIFVPDDTAAIADAKKAGTDAANALDVYKGEMTTALSGKANTADVYSTTVMDTKLAAKADKVEVEQALEGKASTSALAETNTAVAKKADKTYVDTELGKKADAEAMTTALAGKVDNNTFTTELAKKQDVIPVNTYDAYGAAEQVRSDINGTLANYSTTEQVNTELGKKVDKVEGKSLISDTEIARLANVTNYDDTAIKADIAKKADSATMTTELGKKVDKVEGYSLVSDTEIARLADVDNYDDTQVKADIAANTKAITDEATRADAAEKKVLEDAKAYTDGEIEKIVTGSGYATTTYVDNKVAAHETAVNKTLESYSTTEQMNAAIDADVLVETNRATGAEEALAGRIKDLEDNKANYATKTEAQGYADEALIDAKAYTDEVKATILGENDKLIETYDTLAEIGQWIENTGSDVTDLATAIANEAKAREDADKLLATKEELTSLGSSIRGDYDGSLSGLYSEIKGDYEGNMSNLHNEILDIKGDYEGNIDDLHNEILDIKGDYDGSLSDLHSEIGSKYEELNSDLRGEITSATEGMYGELTNIINALADGAVKTNTDAIAAINDEKDGILAQAKAYSDSLNHEDTKYTAAADGGLKLNANNSFAIDDSLVFVFDCGSATENI